MGHRNCLSHCRPFAHTALLGVVTGALACGEPFPDRIVIPDRCDIPMDDVCWTSLGTSGPVTSLAVSHWGITVGTATWGVRRLNPSTWQWESTGLSVTANVLLYQPERKRMFVGVDRPVGDPTSGASLYVMRDGLRWEAADSGIVIPWGAYPAVEEIEHDSSDPDRLYAAWNFHVCRSDDGGRHWRYVRGNPNLVAMGYVHNDLLGSQHVPGRLWMTEMIFPATVAVDTIPDTTSVVPVSWSDDGGETWTAVGPATGRAWDGGHAIVEDPWDPNGLWVGATSGLYRSDDLGATWRQVFADTVPTLRLVATRERVVAAARVNLGLVDTWDPVPYRAFQMVLRQFRPGRGWTDIPVPEGVLAEGTWVGAMVADEDGRVLLGAAAGVDRSAGTGNGSLWLLTFGHD